MSNVIYHDFSKNSCSPAPLPTEDVRRAQQITPEERLSLAPLSALKLRWATVQPTPIRRLDRNAVFRFAFVKAFIASGAPHTGIEMIFVNWSILQDPEISCLPGARRYSVTTLRRWIRNLSGKPDEFRLRVPRDRRGYGNGHRCGNRVGHGNITGRSSVLDALAPDVAARPSLSRRAKRKDSEEPWL